MKQRDGWWSRAGSILLASGIMLMISGIGSQAIAQETEYVEEVRGVWVTNVASNVLHSKQSIANAMDYLADNGFNVIFPVVWNKAETQYVSQVMIDEFNHPIEPLFAQQGRDPLAELIVEAHRRGMEIIPWFEYGFAASFGSTQGNRILNKYPHWAALDINGNVAERNDFYWLNGIHPEVQDFMKRLIYEVIENYDVDGIQGDDRLPAMPTNGGYDPFTIDLYRSEHGGNNPPSNSLDNNWLEWRAGKLTNFLGRLYRGVKERDEHLIVSMSPSQYSFGYTNYLQDTPRWMDSSYVDMIHPQLYRGTASAYLNELNIAIGDLCRNVAGGAFCTDENRDQVVGGYIRRQDLHKFSPGIITRAGNTVYGPSIISQKVAYNRERGVQGEVYFFYEGMGAANSDLAVVLGDTYYDTPAILPFRNGTLRRPPATIVNETDASVDRVGNWQAFTPGPTPPGYEGRSLRATAGSGASLTYNIDVPYDAWYRVYTYIPRDNNSGSVATTTAAYTVYYNEGADSVVTVIDQRPIRNQGWMSIGNVYLEAGEQPVVRVRADDVTDGNPIYADAVMLILDRSKSPDVEIQVPIASSIRNDRFADGELPVQSALMPAYPNPFNPTTNISYQLADHQHVRISVYDLLGRQVSVLVDQTMPAGEHTAIFDATGLASGIYLYTMEAGSQRYTRKMMLVK